MSDHAPAPSTGRGKRHWRVLAAWGLLITGVAQFGDSSGSALGPVIALVPPDQVTSDAFGFVNQVVNPTISNRGEAAAIEDLQTAAEFDISQGGFVLLDTAGPDQMIPGLAIAVSGNGCAVVWARQGFDDTGGPFTSIGITERCRGFDGEFTRVGNGYTGNEQMAVSVTGRFAVFPVPADFNASPTLRRFDIDTGAVAELPNPNKLFWRTDNGLDVSADGNIVVATGDVATNVTDVFIWEVGTGSVRALGATGTTNVGVSADGRFVTFDSIVSSTISTTFVPIRRAVFVFDRVTGSVTQVSGATDNAVQPSISDDGSQVAFAAGPCSLRSCTINRVDVAYSPVPGLTGGIQYDTVSLDVNGRPAQGFEPDLSGNGRWIVFTSSQGALLTGNPGISGLQAFVRRRDPGLAISPNPIDFGTIAVNTSATSTATVTNTGKTSVNMDSISATPAGSFTLVGGGTCVQGSSLPPGASCTVNVRFSAPGSATTVTGSLTVSETGFDPVPPATIRLIGRSTVGPTTTSSSTSTTTTTVRGQIPPPPSTSTTVAGSVILDALPSPVDFGGVAVGIAAPFQTVTVTNLGTASGVVATEMLGANPDDFFVSENLCSGVTLAPGASCTISVTMVALAGGLRTAELTITSGGVGGSVTLQGVGRFAPRMIASPGAVTERGFTTVVGQGFPPNQGFEVRIVEKGLVFNVTSDATGVFALPLAPLALRLTLGDYVVSVAATDAFEEVKAALVVVLPTFEPQGPGGPAFGNTLIVTRGG